MHDEGTNSRVKVFGNIFISFIGAGILGLPYAFKEAGILEGMFIMIMVGIASVKAMLLLVDCKAKIISDPSLSTCVNKNRAMGSQEKDLILDYGEVGYTALGVLGRTLVDISIIVSQIGFVCAYLIFISENFFSINNTVPKLEYVILLLVPLAVLCNLRHLKNLAYFSLFADFANVFAYCIVFYFDLRHFHLVSVHVRTVSLQGLPFFLGIAIYCYEGAGLVLSLEQSLVKDIRSSFKGVFKFALFLVTTLYILFGILGYLSFGPETKNIITLNLPEGNIPLIVKLCLCVSLFFTYPVMMFPVSEIAEKRLFTFSPESTSTNFVKGCILRVSLVVTTGVIVAIIPNFSTLMALVGSSCCTLLGFILPSVFHMVLFKGELSNTGYLLDVFLIVLGILGMMIGMQDALTRLFKPHITTGLVQQNESSSTGVHIRSSSIQRVISTQTSVLSTKSLPS